MKWTAGLSLTYRVRLESGASTLIPYSMKHSKDRRRCNMEGEEGYLEVGVPIGLLGKVKLKQ